MANRQFFRPPGPDASNRRDLTRALVQGFHTSLGPEETNARQLILDLLDQTADPFSRKQFEPGHVTASGLVLSPDETKVLLVRHLRLGRWLQPGGHSEPQDRSPEQTARRETIEETGVTLKANSPGILITLDVHPIAKSQGEPAHHHFDLMFRFDAGELDIAGSAEVGGAIWCDRAGADLSRYQVDGALLRGLARSG